jgi:hypothetical protein
MNEPDEQDYSRVKEAAQLLAEHFDSVQIFVSRHEQTTHGGTININYGTGNWFARYGQINNWLTREDEYERINSRRKNENTGD